jgi:hypothetical protein
MRYYCVKAKCGHVGRNNYIEKNFYVKAENGKEAALIVRNKPRVKHHQKDAIINVIEISLEEYVLGKKINEKDDYFHIHDSSTQRKIHAVNENEIIKEIEIIKYKKNRNGQNLKNQIIWKEGLNQIKEFI